jgi:hypothetical protein
MLSLCAAMSLSACVTGYVPPPANLSPRVATEVGAPYDSTWAIVVSYFADHNIAIRTIEKASGIIVAEAARADLLPNRRWKVDSLGNTISVNGAPVPGPGVYAECGSYNDAPIDPQTGAFNVRVLGAATRSTVRVNVRYLAARPLLASAVKVPAVLECTSTGRWETELEASVKLIAERSHTVTK